MTENHSPPSPPRRTWRRVALVALALLLILVGIVVVRALRFASVQPRVKPVPLVAVDRPAVLKRLGDAIRLRTVSHPDPKRVDHQPFVALRKQLATAFPRLHRQLTREVLGGHSVVYTWKGSDPSKRPVLLLSHVDVVPVEQVTRSQWTVPPYSGVVRDGYLWGRGTMDDKGQVLAMLEAVEFLLGQGFRPTRTVIIAIGHDEEVGGHRGAEQVAKTLKRRGIRPLFTLDEGLVITKGIIPGVNTPVAVVGIAEKGYVTLELTVRGEGGHSSMPPRSTTVGILGKALHDLEQNPMSANLEGPILRTLEAVGPEMPFAKRLVFANLWLFGGLVKKRLVASPATNAVMRTTFAPTMLEGSPRENVLAKRARAVVNVRIHPRDSIASVVQHARLVIPDKRVTVRALREGATEPVPSSGVQTVGYRLIARSIRQVCPDVVVAPGLMVGTTDSRHYRRLGPAIYRFAPIRITSKDRARFHGIDERIGVKNHLEAITFYAQLIRNADGR